MKRKQVRCRVFWHNGKFGWDAVGYDRQGHSVNRINYGLRKPPTAAQMAKAQRALCGGGRS